MVSRDAPVVLDYLVSQATQLDNRLRERCKDLQAGFPSERLQYPLIATALDGKPFAQVTHRSTPLALVLSSNLGEIIQLKIISSPNSLLVLGHTWLKLHNPSIDWSAARILSWSSFVSLEVCVEAIPSIRVEFTQHGVTMKYLVEQKITRIAQH